MLGPREVRLVDRRSGNRAKELRHHELEQPVPESAHRRAGQPERRGELDVDGWPVRLDLSLCSGNRAARRIRRQETCAAVDPSPGKLGEA
jgi:hypothetical protein